MTIRWTFGAAVLAACVAATAAQANVETLAQSGRWRAIGGTTTHRQAICGMTTVEGGVWYFALKHAAGQSAYVVQTGNAAWRVADGKHYNLTVRFDGRAQWSRAGVTNHLADGVAGIEFWISRQQRDLFMRELFSSHVVTIHIDSGRDGGLTDLLFQTAGAGNVRAAFEACDRRLR